MHLWDGIQLGNFNNLVNRFIFRFVSWTDVWHPMSLLWGGLRFAMNVCGKKMLSGVAFRLNTLNLMVQYSRNSQKCGLWTFPMSSFLAGRQCWNFGGFDSHQTVEAMDLLEGANTTTNHNDTSDCPCDLSMAMGSLKFLDDIPIYINALSTGSAWMTSSSQHPPTLDEHHPGTLDSFVEAASTCRRRVSCLETNPNPASCGASSLALSMVPRTGCCKDIGRKVWCMVSGYTKW